MFLHSSTIRFNLSFKVHFPVRGSGIIHLQKAISQLCNSKQLGSRTMQI